AQKARTRAESSANATTASTPSIVSRNSVKWMCCAKYERSKAPSFEKSGGFGKTPCVNANSMITTLMNESKIAHTEIAAGTAGKLDRLIEVFVRKIWITLAPPAGTTFLNPAAAT